MVMMNCESLDDILAKFTFPKFEEFEVFKTLRRAEVLFAESALSGDL